MSENGTIFKVRVDGLRELLIARPPRDVRAEAKQSPEDKFELNEDNHIIIRDTRIKSGLHTDFSKKMCVTRRHYKSTERNKAGMLMWGLLDFNPTEFPVMRDGVPIVFEGFGKNGVELDIRTAFGKGVPVEAERPCIMLPWYLEFLLTVYETDEYNAMMAETDLGRLGNIGIGSFNHMFGKFEVTQWEEVV